MDSTSPKNESKDSLLTINQLNDANPGFLISAKLVLPGRFLQRLLIGDIHLYQMTGRHQTFPTSILPVRPASGICRTRDGKDKSNGPCHPVVSPHVTTRSYNDGKPTHTMISGYLQNFATHLSPDNEMI